MDNTNTTFCSHGLSRVDPDRRFPLYSVIRSGDRAAQPEPEPSLEDQDLL